jgi:hypothetical protein
MCNLPGITRSNADHEFLGSKAMSDFTMNDTKRFLVALIGGLLMSVACLTAALAPANAAAPTTVARPILL